MWYLLVSIVALGLTGCGLTGATSTFSLRIPVAGTPPPLAVGSVDLEPRAARLVNIGTYAWGRYDQADLDVLDASLRNTVSRTSGPGTPPRIHVVVRSFLITSSNTGGAMLSCVAWALTAPDGELILHEQLYATGTAHLNNTLGGLKNDVHKAIVRRIVETAVRVGQGPADNVRPADVENTYERFDEAQATLPKELTSVFFAGLPGGIGY